MSVLPLREWEQAIGAITLVVMMVGEGWVGGGGVAGGYNPKARGQLGSPWTTGCFHFQIWKVITADLDASSSKCMFLVDTGYWAEEPDIFINWGWDWEGVGGGRGSGIIGGIYLVVRKRDGEMDRGREAQNSKEWNEKEKKRINNQLSPQDSKRLK